MNTSSPKPGGPTALVAAEPISAYDAKTHLPQLLQRAQSGEHFVITRHGKPVARLVPYTEDNAAAVAHAIERGARIRAALARKGVTLARVLAPGESVRGLAHEGHRY